MEGIFVTGTCTGVGKTTICAGLLKMASEKHAVSYWKPVQTGTVIGDDTREVQTVTELGDEYFIDPGYRFADPTAPWIASRHSPEPINLRKLIEIKREAQASGRKLIVEGAGGLLVPLSEDVLLVELIRQLELPVLIVSEGKLGTINQTLLTVRACREFGLDVLGVVMTKTHSTSFLGNSECISRFGEVEILAEFAESSDRRGLLTSVCADTRLRQLYDLPKLPL